MILRNTDLKTFFDSTGELETCEFVVPVVDTPFLTTDEQQAVLTSVNSVRSKSYILELVPQLLLDSDLASSLETSITNQLPHYGHKKKVKISFVEIKTRAILGRIVKNPVSKTVIICSDPIEQHSFHLPLGTDIIISERLKSCIVDKYTDVVSAVGINYTVLRWALGMGASLSIELSTYRKLLVKYIDFMSKFFNAIIVVSTHKAKTHTQAISSVLNKRRQTLVFLSPLEFTGFYNYDHHAGILETSLITHIDKKLVKFGNFSKEKSEILTFDEISEISSRSLLRFSNMVKKRKWNGIVSNMGSLVEDKIMKRDTQYLEGLGRFFWGRILQGAEKELERLLI